MVDNGVVRYHFVVLQNRDVVVHVESKTSNQHDCRQHAFRLRRDSPQHVRKGDERAEGERPVDSLDNRENRKKHGGHCRNNLEPQETPVIRLVPTLFIPCVTNKEQEDIDTYCSYNEQRSRSIIIC